MIAGFDHVAIPIRAVDSMLVFYRNLGFKISDNYGPSVYSVHFNENKINFHAPELWQSEKFSLRGPTAQPGCGDFCFVWNDTEQALSDMLKKANAEIVEGPVDRKGGRDGGRAGGTSIYIRDPDSNLLEFIIYS